MVIGLFDAKDNNLIARIIFVPHLSFYRNDDCVLLDVVAIILKGIKNLLKRNRAGLRELGIRCKIRNISDRDEHEGDDHKMSFDFRAPIYRLSEVIFYDSERNIFLEELFLFGLKNIIKHQYFFPGIYPQWDKERI